MGIYIFAGWKLGIVYWPLGVAVYIVANMFAEYGENPGIILYIISMIVMCSTTVCCYLAYRYMSPTFGMAVLLSVGAAWFVVAEVTGKKNALLNLAIASVFLTVSLGLYQANIGCFCVIIILAMVKCVYNDESKKSLLIFGKAFLCGVVSCIFYKIAWDVCMIARRVVPASYNGANSLSIPHMILSLPKSIIRIYRYWFSFFKFRGSNYVFGPIRVVVVALIFILIIIVAVKKLRKSPKNLVLFLLFYLLLPIGANIFIILAPDSIGVLTQMTFSMMMVIPLFLFFLLGNGIKMDRVLLIMAALLLYGNIYAAGTDIDAMAQGSNSSNTIMNNIVVTLNEKQLVSSDYQYAFFGNISENVMFKTNELYDKASQYAKFGTMQKKPDMVHKSYIGLVDDISVNLKIVDNDLYHAIYYSGVLEDMPAYPAEESIVEMNGVVIVKVSEDYKVE